MAIRAITLLLLMSASVLIPVAAVLANHNRLARRTEFQIATAPAGEAANPITAHPEDYVFVGGQNGSWFGPGQFPLLYQISLADHYAIPLDPVKSGGTVWGGGVNGSQMLVSGWGSDDHSNGPYIWLYNGAHVVTRGSLDDYGNATSWNGGDIFAASYNGKEWLLSGLGSGPLPRYSNDPVNHMSLGTFNGTAFRDLSNLVPDQQDAILYANSWNGQYWLVGGGFVDVGILFTYDGGKIANLTSRAMNAISGFGSVQAIAWNGEYWLIGGVGFLAKYDGRRFVDLTLGLEHSLSTYDFDSVNAIAWNGESWMIGGGAPIAELFPSNAWLVSYDSNGFHNLSSRLPSYISNTDSSILAITCTNGIWLLGGYSSRNGILLAYNDGILTDYSSLVGDFTYVDWVSTLQVLGSGKVDYGLQSRISLIE